MLYCMLTGTFCCSAAAWAAAEAPATPALGCNTHRDACGACSATPAHGTSVSTCRTLTTSEILLVRQFRSEHILSCSTECRETTTKWSTVKRDKRFTDFMENRFVGCFNFTSLSLHEFTDVLRTLVRHRML